MADDNDDINVKRARESADYVVLQERVEQYKAKLIDLQNKIYQGKYNGVSIQMKGDYTVINTSIDQSFYETASRNQLENSFLVCYTNLHSAITSEQKDVTEQMQNEISRFQMDAINNK